MTKDQYLAMCEQLGSEPIESEIPLEYSDLPHEAQQAHEVFHYLPDRLDGFSGTYMGKELAGMRDIMDILKVEDPYHTLHFLRIMIAEVSRQFEAKRPKNGK